MSNSEIRTTKLHLQYSDDHDDQKLIWYADCRIHQRNLADATDSVWISEFDIKTLWIIFYSVYASMPIFLYVSMPQSPYVLRTICAFTPLPLALS